MMGGRSKGLLVAVLVVALLFLPIWLVQRNAAHVYDEVTLTPKTPVALVFGAGLKNGGTEPSDVLDDRLRAASWLYEEGRVERILVSGDNRFESYSEPDVMRRTLVERYGVPEEDVYTDYAGRRTYDSCKRARDQWGVEHATLVTQAYHLPRAIWTCRSLGVEAVGVSASLQTYVEAEWYQVRELLATYKAVLDVWILSPDVIGGELEEDLDP